MKLNEILNEQAATAVDKFLEDFRLVGLMGDEREAMSFVLDDKQNLLPHINALSVVPKADNLTLSWPWSETSGVKNFECGTNKHSYAVNLGDFTNIPTDCWHYHFINAKFDSFHGLKRCHTAEYLVFSEVGNDFQCNALSLLKMPKLMKIYFNTVNVSPSARVKFKKLSQILTRHLEGHRDIADCQEELIDEGLEEFAKL